MGAMDQHALDVCSGRWTGVECGIIAFAELRPAVSVMEIDDNVGGIEQDDQVVCTENPIRIDWRRESPNVGAQ